MCLGLSHLNVHNFKHGSSDTINSLSICGGDIESINHFFLHFPEHLQARETLFDNIQSIDKMLLSQNGSSLTHLLLHSEPKRKFNVNTFILSYASEVTCFVGCQFCGNQIFIFFAFSQFDMKMCYLFKQKKKGRKRYVSYSSMSIKKIYCVL